MCFSQQRTAKVFSILFNCSNRWQFSSSLWIELVINPGPLTLQVSYLNHYTRAPWPDYNNVDKLHLVVNQLKIRDICRVAVAKPKGSGSVQLYWRGFESRLKHKGVGKSPISAICEATAEISALFENLKKPFRHFRKSCPTKNLFCSFSWFLSCRKTSNARSFVFNSTCGATVLSLQQFLL